MLVKVLVPEPDSEDAERLLDLAAADDVELVVPSLAFYEIANALRFSKNTGGRAVGDLMEPLYGLELTEVPPSRELLAAAAAEAKRLSSSVYDAVYLLLAKSRNGLFVTADREFDKKARSRHVTTLDKAARELRR